MSGTRLGWLASRDRDLVERCLNLKYYMTLHQQSRLDETVAMAALYIAGPKHELRMFCSLIGMPLFLLRDLMFIQWCRFTKSRRPEVMALTYLFLSYVLPWIVFVSTKNAEQAYLFGPFYGKSAALWHVAPAVFQAAVMSMIATKRIQTHLAARPAD